MKKHRTAPQIPSHVRDHRNNPVWQFPVLAEVSRQDNSLSLTQAVGSLESKTKYAEIVMVYGGFVFIAEVQDKKKGKPQGDTRRYALNARSIIERIIEFDDELRRVPRVELRKKSKS